MDEQRLQEIQSKLPNVGISARIWMRELIAEVRQLHQDNQTLADLSAQCLVKRDAALAERDIAQESARALAVSIARATTERDEAAKSRGEAYAYVARVQDERRAAQNALTEARRVLRECSDALKIARLQDGAALLNEIAAVLAQEE